MLKAKDPAIKLFGKKIPVPEIPASLGPEDGCSSPVVDDAMDQDHASSTNSSPEGNTNRDGEERELDKNALGEQSIGTNQEHACPEPLVSEELSNPNSGSGISDNHETVSVEKDSGMLQTPKSEEEQSESSNPQEKTLKKPDKILPCPRCKSMDTKFCYYNNYNVNQPRHFCKNCQRYWTAGGTMRNVPVGAGRRKNKCSASHYRHITVPVALQSAQNDVGVHPSLNSNGTVLLTFGTDTPLCESMASVLNLSNKTSRHCAQNGFHKPEGLRIPVSYGGGESGNDHSNKSSITDRNSKDEAGKTVSQEQVMYNCRGFPAQVEGYPGAHWPYPRPSVQCSPLVPTFCPPNFPMPFYPTAAYWGYSVPGVWNVPWVPLTSSANEPASSSGPNSPTLGKHSRDENTHKTNSSVEGELPKESNPERCLWVPKTLRIDDPGEAAKSFLWATLGIKNDKADAIGGRGLFKAFQTKGGEKNHVSETSSVLQANPAALSRSVNFQERS